MNRLPGLVAGLALAFPAAAMPPPLPEVANASMASLQADVAAGRASSEAITSAYIVRGKDIEPRVNAVIALNPAALSDARTADLKRRTGERGPLLGAAILVKDNIETADAGLATTAGSLALADNVTGRDAPVIARLRAAGAVVLGKTNLSEWANIRSDNSISGWSAVGGQTRNPYALDRSPCGSSSGTGAAVAAGRAAAGIGTETDGSITCPAAVTGLVGLKPTVGLVSRSGIVPISATQDTAGPMTRTVEDAALLLTAMAGSDPADPGTAQADRRREDYAARLKPDALKGARIGVMRYAAGFHPETDAVFEAALATLKARGAVLVDVPEFPKRGEIGKNELIVLLVELKAGLNAYLATTDPTRVKTRTLADVIAFNRANAGKEMALFGQELFEQAEATKGLHDPAYLKARADAARLAGPEGIDALLAKYDVTALVGPTLGPAWPIDPVLKDRYVGGGAGGAAAVAGYPHLTVPMGQVLGLPVGLSFVGPAWSDGLLLGYGYAFERAAGARKAPTFPASVN
ncbi:MAG: amidase [Caulobacter sp.]|nr:amidase [Caulobacter sp.]